MRIFAAWPTYGTPTDDDLFAILRDPNLLTEETVARMRERIQQRGEPNPQDPEEYGPLRNVHPAFRQSMMETIRYVAGRHELALASVAGDGQLDRARAFLLSQYLKASEEHGPFDYFWQLDCDIEWPPEVIDHMIARDKDVLGAFYTFKVPPGHPKHGKPVCRGLKGEEIDRETGLIKVRGMAGGFIFIRDSALRRMMELRPDELMYVNPDYGEQENQPGAGLIPTYHFWQCLAVPEADLEGKKIYLSEDYALCQRLIWSGFDVWGDTWINLRHWAQDRPYMVAGAEEANQRTLEERAARQQPAAMTMAEAGA